MFMGPLEVSKPWSQQGVEGAKRFINRVWNFFTESTNVTDDAVPALDKIYHKTIKKKMMIQANRAPYSRLRTMLFME